MTTTLTAQPPARKLFAYRDFRLLWIGETTSKLGSSITSVALPLVAVTVLHASTLQWRPGSACWLSGSCWPWPC